MQTALKRTVTVQKAGLIQILIRIQSPELPGGAQAEVVFLMESGPIGYMDSWSDEDLKDVTGYSLPRAAGSLAEDPNRARNA